MLDAAAKFCNTTIELVDGHSMSRAGIETCVQPDVRLNLPLAVLSFLR
jgi:hypothetical protein